MSAGTVVPNDLAELAQENSKLTADDVVRLLELAPHPEGGFYRETFRDTATMADNATRAMSTCIYFLLPRGIVSRWHTVDAVETWHWYSGSPLLLSIAPPDGGDIRQLRLSNDLRAGDRPQGIVPFAHWQQAESLGDWTLVGCTVAPGFEFSGFTMAPPGWSPNT